MRISDWSSDVCSSDLLEAHGFAVDGNGPAETQAGRQVASVQMDFRSGHAQGVPVEGVGSRESTATRRCRRRQPKIGSQLRLSTSYRALYISADPAPGAGVAPC